MQQRFRHSSGSHRRTVANDSVSVSTKHFGGTVPFHVTTGGGVYCLPIVFFAAFCGKMRSYSESASDHGVV